MAKVFVKETQSRAVAGRKPRQFYLGITLFMIALVIKGFWPSYFGPLLSGTATRPWVIHLHGIVFSGWMVLLLAQALLVALGRTATHRKVGEFGMFYGGLVLLMGLIVGFVAPILHVQSGEWTRDRAAGFLLVILGDMALFAVFFIGAMIYQREPEVHKRMIVLATVALLFAAVARMGLFDRPLLMLAVWLSPVIIAMGYDIFSRRRVHPAYFVGSAILLVGYSRVLFLESEAWLRMGRVLLGFFV
jgi:hypothetical protein